MKESIRAVVTWRGRWTLKAHETRSSSTANFSRFCRDVNGWSFSKREAEKERREKENRKWKTRRERKPERRGWSWASTYYKETATVYIHPSKQATPSSVTNTNILCLHSQQRPASLSAFRSLHTSYTETQINRKRERERETCTWASPYLSIYMYVHWIEALAMDVTHPPTHIYRSSRILF